MNLHTERAEMLSSSLMNLGQSRSSTSTNNSSLPSLHGDDKDSIYTFSNDESDYMDHSKYGSRLSSTALNTAFSATTDKNLNDTHSFAVKDGIRTYSKKKVSSSASPRSERKKAPMFTTYSNSMPSCSPLQSLSSVHLSPFSDESNPQMLKLNGNAQTGRIPYKFLILTELNNQFSISLFHR